MKGTTRNINDLEAIGAMFSSDKAGEQMTVMVDRWLLFEAAYADWRVVNAYIGLLRQVRVGNRRIPQARIRVDSVSLCVSFRSIELKVLIRG